MVHLNDGGIPLYQGNFNLETSCKSGTFAI